MAKLLRSGRIVIVLNGRMAGKKGVILHCSDTGTKGRAYGHCLVAGVERAPLKVNRKMSQKKIQRRSRIKPFVRYLNYNHIMPTRYLMATDFASDVNLTETLDAETKRKLKKATKQYLQERLTKAKTDRTAKYSKDIFFLKKKLRF